MKKLLTILALCVFTPGLFADAYLDCISKVENFLNKKYPQGSVAHSAGIRKLNKIIDSPQGDSEKISAVKNAFPDAFALSEAEKKFLSSAQSGNAQAQLDLGRCCYLGEGIGQSFEQAVYWFRKAAEQGNAKAQYNLGLCYYHGRGVDKSSREAVSWWQKAAEKGIDFAQYNLAGCYLRGEGVEKDYDKAYQGPIQMLTISVILYIFSLSGQIIGILMNVPKRSKGDIYFTMIL